jgi:hypothetical protein
MGNTGLMVVAYGVANNAETTQAAGMIKMVLRWESV